MYVSIFSALITSPGLRPGFIVSGIYKMPAFFKRGRFIP